MSNITHNKGERWTEQKLDRIRELAEKYYDYFQIAADLETEVNLIRSICHRYDIDVKNKHIENLAEKRDMKGVPKFGTPHKNEIKNYNLYGTLKNQNMPPSQLAKKIGVSNRSVQRWIYEGHIPDRDNMYLIGKILNEPPEELFDIEKLKKIKPNSVKLYCETCQEVENLEKKIKKLRKENKRLKSKLNNKIKRPLF